MHVYMHLYCMQKVFKGSSWGYEVYWSRFDWVINILSFLWGFYQLLVIYNVYGNDLGCLAIITNTLHCLKKPLRNTPRCFLSAYTHIYNKVYDMELHSGSHRWHECLWTLMDPDTYMHQIDLFSYFSLCFSLLLSSQRHYMMVYHHHGIMYDNNPLSLLV